MNNAAFSAALAVRLAHCALAATNRDFSAAADRLAQLGLNGATAGQQRLVRAAGRRALTAWLARR